MLENPLEDVIKLNTDGSTTDNPDNIGVGGIGRNNHGMFIFAYSVPMGVGTNNQAELEAALFGLQWCFHLGYRKVILEMDS